MKIHDILFSTMAIALSLALFLLLLESGSLTVPRDLRDPRWGTLPEFETALRPIHCGTPRDAVTNLLAKLPWETNAEGQVTCLWESQQQGFFKESTTRRFTFAFGPDGCVTNILVIDNEGQHFIRVILR